MSAVNRELLAAVIADPDDDEPRIVLADWYLEKGDPRGEFIAGQCRLARSGLSPAARQHWRSRVAALERKHGDEWANIARSIPAKWRFRRGFIDKITGKAKDVLGAWRPLWESEPVLWLELTQMTTKKACQELARSGILGRIRHLTIRGNIGDRGAGALAESPDFGHLERLNLLGNGIGDDGLRSLLEADGFALETLSLTGNKITDEGASAVADSENAAGLRVLHLSRNEIGDDGVTALAESPHLGKLDTLALGSHEEITDEGAKALVESTTLTSLRRLELDMCEVSNKVFKALRGRFAQVRSH